MYFQDQYIFLHKALLCGLQEKDTVLGENIIPTKIHSLLQDNSPLNQRLLYKEFKVCFYVSCIRVPEKIICLVVCLFVWVFWGVLVFVFSFLFFCVLFSIKQKVLWSFFYSIFGGWEVRVKTLGMQIYLNLGGFFLPIPYNDKVVSSNLWRHIIKPASLQLRHQWNKNRPTGLITLLAWDIQVLNIFQHAEWINIVGISGLSCTEILLYERIHPWSDSFLSAYKLKSFCSS